MQLTDLWTLFTQLKIGKSLLWHVIVHVNFAKCIVAAVLSWVWRRWTVDAFRVVHTCQPFHVCHDTLSKARKSNVWPGRPQDMFHPRASSEGTTHRLRQGRTYTCLEREAASLACSSLVLILTSCSCHGRKAASTCLLRFSNHLLFSRRIKATS